MSKKNYVTIAFFHDRLHFLSRAAVYDMIRRGDLPSPDITLPSKRMYWREDVARAAVQSIMGAEVAE